MGLWDGSTATSHRLPTVHMAGTAKSIQFCSNYLLSTNVGASYSLLCFCVCHKLVFY